MKNVKFLIFTAFIVVFLSCSTNYAPSIDDDSSLDSQTRGSETSQNDSTDGGVNATIMPRDTITVDIIATEVPKDEAKNDSIPNDSIPNDSTKINRHLRY